MGWWLEEEEEEEEGLGWRFIGSRLRWGGGIFFLTKEEEEAAEERGFLGDGGGILA